MTAETARPAIRQLSPQSVEVAPTNASISLEQSRITTASPISTHRPARFVRRGP
jgi:hypothetical protein